MGKPVPAHRAIRLALELEKRHNVNWLRLLDRTPEEAGMKVDFLARKSAKELRDLHALNQDMYSVLLIIMSREEAVLRDAYGEAFVAHCNDLLRRVEVHK